MARTNACARLGTVSHNCRLCPYRQNTEFAELDDEAADLLGRHVSKRRYGRGTVVAIPEEVALVCVNEGSVGVFKSDEQGNTLPLQLVGPGNVIGQPYLFSEKAPLIELKTFSPLTLCFIDKQVVEMLLRRRPQIGLAFLRSTARQVEELEQNLYSIYNLSVRARLAAFLLRLVRRQGAVERDRSGRFRLPYTKRDIASFLGMRPETLARTIHALADDGVVFFKHYNVFVPHLDNLEREAGALRQ